MSGYAGGLRRVREGGERIQPGGGKNVRGHVSSHTSCLESVNYPAVGYYVFI